MSERDDALRATTGDLIADAKELTAIEQTKAALAPDDPRLDGLAADAEALVRQMVPKTTAQREIVRPQGDGARHEPEDLRDAEVPDPV